MTYGLTSPDRLSRSSGIRRLNFVPPAPRGRQATATSSVRNRLSKYVRLTGGELDFIDRSEDDPEPIAKGDKLSQQGEGGDIVVLQSGWAVLKSYNKSSGHQILRVFLPGEFVGLSEIGTPQMEHQISMQTSGVVSRLSRRAFYSGVSRLPRLNALLLALVSLDLQAFRHHGSCMRSMSAESNLKFFLLQLRSRLKVAGVGSGDRFHVPFSQVEIGQAVGLTSIYVNKLLRGFRERGELEIDRPYFRLLAREQWKADTDFHDAYENVDTSWFPKVDEADDLSPRNALRRAKVALV
ncbi:Crp/Fnr family transcriptional regulator [Actibacterium sp. 188UL27-1]|uniref:Crp/Fnr family transcriptional regulator n=1 Tax=Actibacterium sp. 188UL27-1 TaxID=2786961 RepID=UPI00195A180A|nr:Crp/Fnr family transcriptional regulator [Actibacterium sp. 188UL27-1]MBM7070062.1 cyclic nucleotide-binding domain-containing protein [Actibacterium sp. 188UL27-1]